ncbi:MAG TPA: FAD binding domain-containing protein [Pseudonocardiaceae bacterium]
MNLDDVTALLSANGAEPRGGGTDLTARQRIGRATGPFIDLGGVRELHGIRWLADGSARIGAMTTVAALATDPTLRAAYPGLTGTAAGLATPQIRAAGTLGGNLLQRNRCWYYRNPLFACFQTGGHGCPARAGAHLYATVIDQGPCVAPHPSSIAMGLLAYGAQVMINGRGGARSMPVADLYGDGSDPTRDHLLAPAEVLTAVELPAPTPGERAAYHRAIARAEAEWPLVEAVARLVLDGGTITTAAVAVGGVARTPLRLPEVEDALVGREATAATLQTAAAAAMKRCAPLPQTGYKVALLRDTVVEVLERAADGRRPD